MIKTCFAIVSMMFGNGTDVVVGALWTVEGGKGTDYAIVVDWDGGEAGAYKACPIIFRSRAEYEAFGRIKKMGKPIVVIGRKGWSWQTTDCIYVGWIGWPK